MPSECDLVVERLGNSGDLPEMIATLASYDRMFGPVSMQTLSLAALVGRVLAESGEVEPGRRLLERVARDVVRAGGPTHRVRLAALASLRELQLKCDDLDAAIRTQAELTSCWLTLAGPGARQTIEAKSLLGSLLMLPASATEA